MLLVQVDTRGWNLTNKLEPEELERIRIEELVSIRTELPGSQLLDEPSRSTKTASRRKDERVLD